MVHVLPCYGIYFTVSDLLFWIRDLGKSYLYIRLWLDSIFYTVLFQILIHLSVLIFKAEIDLWNIKRKANVPHNLWIYLLAPITIYLWYLNSNTLFILLTINHGFTYWIIFDIYLNKRRNLDYDYIGENSLLDRFLFWFKNRNINVLIPKVIFLSISLSLYFYFLKYPLHFRP